MKLEPVFKRHVMPLLRGSFPYLDPSQSRTSRPINQDWIGFMTISHLERYTALFLFFCGLHHFLWLYKYPLIDIESLQT